MDASEEKDLEFIRLVICDFYGRSLGVLKHASDLPSVLKNGHGAFIGLIAGGPRHGVPLLPALVERKFCNVTWRPVETKIRKVPCTGSEPKVGDILCEPYEDDSTPQAASPRWVLRKQLDELKKHGLTLKSAFELEFILNNADTREPCFNKMKFHSTEILSQFKHVTCAIMKDARQLGIEVEHCELEFAPGQFELSFRPKLGIETADDMFIFRQGLRDTCRKFNLVPTFMACPSLEKSHTCGCHLNMSLWQLDDPSKNVFSDGNNQLTETGRYFIGGIIAHLDALMCFYSPTINCYRRIRTFVVRSGKDWDFKNRFASLRIEQNKDHGARLEIRLNSTIANPYLSTAATLAAGVDGINKRIKPPHPGQRDEFVVGTLKDAVEALENDNVLKNALGKEFIDWWLFVKRECELKPMGHHNIKESIADELEMEKNVYFDM